MAGFDRAEKVRLVEATRHAVAHGVKIQEGPVITTRCGWQPSTPGAVMTLGRAIIEHDAFCCVRCFRG
jgi:hypothetical protein